MTSERGEQGRMMAPVSRGFRGRRGEAADAGRLELRGPIGGYFVWQETLGWPVLLIAGGAGVVPLRAILRHRSR